MNFWLFLMGLLLFMTSLFLILVVLVQRGRGGGLTGALGGMGGQSAFGAKAGDTFTRITIVTAIFWIVLCMVTIKFFNFPVKAPEIPSGVSSAPTMPGGQPPADSGIGTQPDLGKALSDLGIPDPNSPGLDPNQMAPPPSLPGGGEFDGLPEQPAPGESGNDDSQKDAPNDDAVGDRGTESDSDSSAQGTDQGDNAGDNVGDDGTGDGEGGGPRGNPG